MENETMFVQIRNEIQKDYSVIIEEDHNAVYGYLIRNEQIISDVWLYNVGNSPDFVDWDNPELMPFPSPFGLSKTDNEIIRIKNERSIRVEWGRNEISKVQASIYYENVLVAVLVEGEFPGKSINAKSDSPLANTITL